MSKPPTPTSENTSVQRHRLHGYTLRWPASKSGKSVYERWFSTKQAAEAAQQELIAPRFAALGGGDHAE